MASSAELAIIISARDTAAKALRDAAKNMSGLDKAARNAGKGLDSLGTKAQAVGRTLTLASLPLIGIGIAATKMAMDAVESENLFEVSMGEMAGAARQFSEELRNQLGLNAYEVRKSVGTFNVMINSMGIGKNAAFDMSKGLTQLSYDMASFYNLKPDEAFQKLQAAISGESEPLKRLGIIINETTIQQWALNNGLIKQGQEMSEAQKVVARYGAIMEATSKAQGDLARTMDSPTNQLRILRSQFDEFMIDLGMEFIPLAQSAFKFLNEDGLPTARNLVNNLKTSWNAMSDDAKKGLLTIVGLTLAGGPILAGLGSVVKAVAIVGTAFNGLTLKVATFGGVAAAAGAAAEAALFAASNGADKFGDRFRSNMANAGNEILGTVEKLGAMLVGDQELIKTSQHIYEIKKELHNLESAEAELKKQASRETWALDRDLTENQIKIKLRLNKVEEQRAKLVAELVVQESKIGGVAVETLGQSVAKAQELVAQALKLDGILTHLSKDKYGASPLDLDEYEAAFMAGKKVAGAIEDIGAAQQKSINYASLWSQANADAGKSASKAAKAVEQEKISVSELTQALIATHPATLAAASAVASINLAISANRDQLKAAQAEYNALSASLRAAEGALQDMQNKLGELNKQLSDARQRFADFGNVNLKGTAAATKEIAVIDEQLKRLKLQELLTGETEATKAFRAELEKAREIANLQFDLGIGKQQQTLKEFQENLGKLSQADLEATLKAIGKSMADIGKLTPAEQLKLMEEVAKRANKELTFEEAITQIIKTKGEIDNLTGAIGAQEAAIRSQQAAIDAIRASMEAQQQVIAAIQSAGEALNATLATIEGKQRLVNDALTLAYDWYLRDREKILEMGGAAEDVAATMDEKTTELLEAITQAASDTSGTSAATLAQMVENYKKEMAKALLEVGALKGQLDGIPREITTIHTTIHKDVYENGGAAGNSSNSVLGSYATGTSYVPQTGPYILHRGEAVVPPGRNSGGNIIMNISVQGNVTTERDLAETIRRELLKVKSRNSTVGLT